MDEALRYNVSTVVRMNSNRIIVRDRPAYIHVHHLYILIPEAYMYFQHCESNDQKCKRTLKF